jgi:hypothetical protein
VGQIRFWLTSANQAKLTRFHSKSSLSFVKCGGKEHNACLSLQTLKHILMLLIHFYHQEDILIFGCGELGVRMQNEHFHAKPANQVMVFTFAIHQYNKILE